MDRPKLGCKVKVIKSGLSGMVVAEKYGRDGRQYFVQVDGTTDILKCEASELEVKAEEA